VADDRFPDDVRDLVRDHVASVAHLEALILLARRPVREYSPARVAAETPVDPATAASVLRDLAAAGLVAATRPGGGGSFRFAPATPALRHAAARLGECYARFPVQVVRAVYEQPEEPR
jgi:hypothetical protein